MSIYTYVYVHMCTHIHICMFNINYGNVWVSLRMPLFSFLLLCISQVIVPFSDTVIFYNSFTYHKIESDWETPTRSTKSVCWRRNPRDLRGGWVREMQTEMRRVLQAGEGPWVGVWPEAGRKQVHKSVKMYRPPGPPSLDHALLPSALHGLNPQLSND